MDNRSLMYYKTLQGRKHHLKFFSPVCSVQATDGDAGTFGIVRYYFSDEPDQ